jgi:hypothetical protein
MNTLRTRILLMLIGAQLIGSLAGTVPPTPPPGKYTCGVFLSGRFMFTQYVTLTAGEYKSSTGPSGKFHYDAASKRLLFDTGNFQPLFGSYEPTPNYPMFRLSSRTDMAESDYTRAWRSQVCSSH